MGHLDGFVFSLGHLVETPWHPKIEKKLGRGCPRDFIGSQGSSEVPKGSQREPKVSQKGSKMIPKGDKKASMTLFIFLFRRGYLVLEKH